ncbi:MAG: S8 family serine peptidase [Acidimicrobiia bacterium]
MRIRALAMVVVVLAGCAVIQRASVAPSGETDGASVQSALDGTGTMLAFASTATNLVSGDTNGVSDVFVRDVSDQVIRISVSAAGTQADGPSSHPSVSGNGRYVAFQSDATNLVANDTNGTTDIFVRDLFANVTTLASVPGPGAPTASLNAPSSPNDESSPTATDPAATNTGPFAATGAAALRARAAVTPQRVIVRTGTAFRAEGTLTSTARVSQRASIRRDQATVDNLVGSNGQINARARTLPIVVATVDAAALDRLTRSPQVMSVTADDPLPAALVNSGPVVGLPAAQDAGSTGRGVAVAILDTGVDTAHPFLGNRVVDEACYSATSSCPNGTTTQTGPGSAAPCTYAPNGCRHGTHVTGIAAGSALDATGVAPRASIIAVQVFSRVESTSFCTRGENPCPLTFPSDWILGLEHVYELRNTHTIAAVNMSIGGITSLTACDGDAVKPAIDQLRSVGIATVIAAGNEGLTNSIGYPACISSSVSVGATDNTDAIASFSNSHPQVSLFAPGVGIRSSVPGGGFANFNGTSMATPHVVGAFALAKEQDPTATIDTILARMKSTGRVIHDARNGVDTPRLCTSGALGFDRCPNRNASRAPAISADGTKVAFESDASLVAADTNRVTDIYLRDMTAATTERISVATGGTQATGASTHASMSATGAVVAFDSLAPNLVAGDTNGVSDVFVRARLTSVTTRVSVNGVTQAAQPSRDASISADGSTVAFSSAASLSAGDTNSLTDIYTASPGGAVLVSNAPDGSPTNGPSRHPAISGGQVVFESDATNLVPDTNGQTDIYVRDLSSGLIQRASTSFFLGQGESWSAAPTISGTPSVIAFTTAGGDLVSPADTNNALDVYRRAAISPVVTSFSGGPYNRGSVGSFSMIGRGFTAPMVLTAGTGVTITVNSVTPMQITGTVTVSASAPVGPQNISVVNLTSVPGIFGGTICVSCLTVT